MHKQRPKPARRQTATREAARGLSPRPARQRLLPGAGFARPARTHPAPPPAPCVAPPCPAGVPCNAGHLRRQLWCRQHHARGRSHLPQPRLLPRRAGVSTQSTHVARQYRAGERFGRTQRPAAHTGPATRRPAPPYLRAGQPLPNTHQATGRARCAPRPPHRCAARSPAHAGCHDNCRADG
ncbi:hypothetical protein G6F46_014145 [Rhizopus delemar]|nr:hypothetical protein G6F46_014145 [Rhizopus delemar]